MVKKRKRKKKEEIRQVMTTDMYEKKGEKRPAYSGRGAECKPFRADKPIVNQLWEWLGIK